jgi:hypothetical protein
MSTATKKVKRSPFGKYRAYVSKLQMMLGETRQASDWNMRINAALNGQASAELRRIVSLKTRRKYGTYFTGTTLSQRLLKKCSTVNRDSIFYDPTVGMGDLLLATASKLSLARNLEETLARWGRQLVGTDLHAEFILGAKTRLVLLARQRHGAVQPFNVSPKKYFPLIKVGDGLAEDTAFKRASTLVLNPPFGLVKAPEKCGWAGGRISAAAIFVINALERCQPGTEILAILPEVLRSGSFSRHWRNRVSQLAEVHTVEPWGIFDESADIDVFILRLVRRADGEKKLKKKWPTSKIKQHTTVGDCFDVHVGRVVPHRDKKTGPCHPYIHPRCVATWTVMKRFSETRKHKGLVYKPPFVVIRRTSRPGHPYRAMATVIAGKRPVAVENHLIVCEPKKGKLNICKKLMRQLRTQSVNKYLDERIRCRHLTVGVVESISFKSK